MNIHEVYNILLAGKTLEMNFGSKAESETFRVKLAKYKRSQDKQLIEIGFMDEKEVAKLSFCVQGQLPPAPPLLATICFKDKAVLRQYEIKILDDEEDQNASAA